MSIPIYQPKQFSLDILTANVVDTALERCDYPTVSTETTRAACYDWLTRSLVWEEHMQQFKKELAPDVDQEDLEDNGYVLECVAYISRKIQEVLMDEEIIEYRDNYMREDDIKAALTRIGITLSTKVTATLVAAYMVGSQRALVGDAALLMEEYGIIINQTKFQVRRIL